MALGITSRFNAYKKQRLTDSAAMERALKDQAAGIAKLRKADAAAAKKRKGTRIARLKRNVRLLLKGPKHSKAGREYLARKR